MVTVALFAVAVQHHLGLPQVHVGTDWSAKVLAAREHSLQFLWTRAIRTIWSAKIR